MPGGTEVSDCRPAASPYGFKRLSWQWDDWFAGMSDDAVQADLTYQDMRGKVWTQPIWKLVLHVVNHATHHRGQASGFLRAMGRTPPVLDLVVFHRLT